MAEEAKKKIQANTQSTLKSVKSAPNSVKSAPKGGAKTVYSKKQAVRKSRSRRNDKPADEFEQKIVDIARVTRVMAGGKRMRFRACVVIGNKKGKVAVGLDKGADVSIAVNKAVNKAKKKFIDVPIVNDTIPHAIYHKFGAAKILLKPAGRGKGVISGGATRTILELSGVKNITTKNLGTNNAVNVAKCTIEALDSLKKIERRKDKKKEVKKTSDAKATPGKENK